MPVSLDETTAEEESYAHPARESEALPAILVPFPSSSRLSDRSGLSDGAWSFDTRRYIASSIVELPRLAMVEQKLQVGRCYRVADERESRMIEMEVRRRCGCRSRVDDIIRSVFRPQEEMVNSKQSEDPGGLTSKAMPCCESCRMALESPASVLCQCWLCSKNSCGNCTIFICQWLQKSS
jgi:hypothetical protein